jgi:hypothetical protein
MPSTKLIMARSWTGCCCSAASMRMTSRTCCPRPRLRSWCAAANCSDCILHYAALYVVIVWWEGWMGGGSHAVFSDTYGSSAWCGGARFLTTTPLRSSSLPRDSRFARLSPPAPTHATGSLTLSDRDAEAQRHLAFDRERLRDRQLLTEVRASKLLPVRQLSESAFKAELADVGYTECDLSYLVSGL